MEPDDNLFYLLLLLALVLAGAFFTMSEVAIISLNDSKIRKMAQDGDRNAQLLVKMLDSPSRFLATIQVGVTVSGFLSAALAAYLFAQRLANQFGGIGLPVGARHPLAILLVTLLTAFVTLIFSELVPKRIGMQYHEAIALAVARPLTLIAAVERPFVFLLSSSTNGVLRLLGVNPQPGQGKVTEEEIRMLVDVGGETGTIEQDEKDMINNIFDFDDRTVFESMTHRTELVAVETGTPLSQIMHLFQESGYSRIPVYEGDVDSIVGILYMKDLLELVMQSADDSSFVLSEYMREPMYVLESTTCKALMEEFQSKKTQIAIVLDEYGGTYGIVTMEDLLEAIVGNIQDEYDDEEEDITPVGEYSYLVGGRASLEETAAFFGLELDVAATDEYETVGGYIVHCLGQLPGEDEHPSVQVGNVVFTVTVMDERRIDKLHAEVLSPREEPESPVEPVERKRKA